VRFAILAALVALAGCPGGAGGTYVKSSRNGGDVDRGEVNGRMFDFVSHKPDGDDWQIRIRGSGLWAAYAREESPDKLGSINLSDKETEKLWKLIDALDLPNHRKGKKDLDEGFVEMQLREPGEDKHDIYKIYVPRDTEDEDVITLANYLADLIYKYKKEKPHF
jgi:hypothetical protein